jgi:hypothetical protein
MAFDRTTIFQEPGLLVFNSQHFYSKGPITVNLIEETTDVESDQFGGLDERPVDRRIEIRLEPVGELEALATLYPHGGLTLGQSIFPANDAAAVIFTPAGRSLTVHNVAVSQMPTLRLGHRETLFGELVLTGLIRKSTEPNAANAYYTWAASGASYPGDAQFDPSAIKTLGYKATWGSAPWADFVCEAGMEVSFTSTLESVPVDGHGTADMRLGDLAATVSGVPLGIAPADLLTARKYQGAGNELGASKGSATDLVIVNQLGATQLHFELYGAVLQETPLAFSGRQRGVGQVQWRATRKLAAGVATPLYYVGTAAPA